MLEQIDIAVGFAVIMLLLSLIVTVIVQAIAAAFDLRGRNLVWGLTKLLHQISPEFELPAGRDWNETKSTLGKKIAEAVSKHPAIAHSWLGRATAVRPEELIRLMRDLSKRPPEDLPPAALEKLRAWAANTSPDPVALAAANAILDRVETSLPNRSAEVRAVIDQVIGSAGRLETGVETWFNTMMDRSTDTFAQMTRWVTVVVAVVLAFGLHINSGDIFHQIAGSSEIRAKLAGMADQTLQQADQIMSAGNRGTLALQHLKEKHKGDNAALATLNKIPANVPAATCRDASLQLAQQSAGDSLLAELSSLCQAEAADALKANDAAFNTLRASLDQSGLEIIPSKLSDSVRDSRLLAYYADSYSDGRQLIGVGATAILLSLGAPFWYNALRQLASLTPQITRTIKKEQAAKSEDSPADSDNG